MLSLTKAKLDALDFEYNGFQYWMIFGIDHKILSQYKRAKGYTYKKEEIKYKSYPLVIPHGSVSFREQETKLTPYWIKIGVAKRKGVGVWLPIKPHKPLLDEQYFRDSQLLKNKYNQYELRLIYDIPTITLQPQNILAIDLGERVMATVCDSVGTKMFLGRDVRGIRRHYAWLRKELGHKKLLSKIKQVGQKEKNLVRNVLHLVSNTIIAIAKEHSSLIVLGDLKGIRKKTNSKTLNRIVFNMPYYTLSTMIEYKAKQQGLTVVKVSEKNTSRTCHRCKSMDTKNRKSQGLFVCSNCKLQYNADLNGTLNILQRAKDQGFLAGALADAHTSGCIA